MAYEIGYVDSTGSEGLAHWQLLLKIKQLAEANGWTTLRYLTPSDGSNRELILQGQGLSGDEQIFVGFQTYHSVTGDYYNIAVATMKGYVDSNGFDTQPGISRVCGVPAHNRRIDYWISLNAQRINGALKVGTPVYESFGVGKFFPCCPPNQWPQPLFVSGMLSDRAATRYSDTTHSMGWKGNTRVFQMHFNDGTWKQPQVHPFTSSANYVDNKPLGGRYLLTRLSLVDAGNVYGWLDGLYHVTGFDNVVENTLTIDGKTYVVVQDTYRTGFADYYALEL